MTFLKCSPMMTAKNCTILCLFLNLLMLPGCSIPQKKSFEYCEVIRQFPSHKVLHIKELEHESSTENLGAISLREAIDISICNQPDIEIALSRIQQAEAAIGEANAAFMPVLMTQTSFLVADAPSAYLFKMIDARTFNPQVNFNYPGSFTNFETDLGLSMQLFRGGRNILNRWKAEKGASLKQLDYLTVQNALIASVIDTYYSSLAFREALEVVRASQETVSKELEIAKIRFDEGAILKSDVLLLQVRLAETEEEVIQSNNAYKLSLASLSNLLGGHADTAIEVVSDQDFLIPQPENYDSAIAMAMCCRPELLSARKQVEVAGIDVSIKKRAFLPEVDLHGRVYWDDEYMHYYGDRTNWIGAVDFKWNLYEGGRKQYALKKSCSLLKEMLAFDRKMALSIQLDVKQAYLNLEHAVSRISTAEVAVQRAEISLKEITEQYQEGVRTITDYLEAELMLTKAHLRKIHALYDYKKSQAEVARSVGLLCYTEVNYENQ